MRFACAALAAALSCPLAAHAVPSDHHCAPIADVLGKSNATATRLTAPQFHFLQGVSAILPFTPAGLPTGASAVWIKSADKDLGDFAFIDGDNVCDPFPAVEKLIEETADVDPSGPLHPKAPL